MLISHSRLLPPIAVAVAAGAALFDGAPRPGLRSGTVVAAAIDSAVSNDNRAAAGATVDGVREIVLEARRVGWRADARVDSLVTVAAFAEPGKAPMIPSPLLRVSTGTRVRLTLRNQLETLLVVHGLRGGSAIDDSVTVARGASRTIEFSAGAPGTYLYWGSTTGKPFEDRRWRDSQLTGALVIDPAGTTPDPRERIFVMSVIDILRDDSVGASGGRPEDVWELGMNGRSWPYTERLTYAVGDTVRWRVLNGSYLPHPMHLHGFHFRVLSKNNGDRDSLLTGAAQREAVTELLRPGASMRMAWVPTRAGSWLMHCHMIPHITPFPERPDSVRGHDVQAVEQHPSDAMAGLVLGITTVDRRDAPATPLPSLRGARPMRLLVQKGRAAPRAAGDTTNAPVPVRHAYVWQRGGAPRADSVTPMSSTLVLRRGERTAITVVNRLHEPTTVHWHGMELESVYDGVSGFSRTGTRVAPLLAPGDSFTAVMTPPRAGTFLYHTHMDEGAQLSSGLYGALVVLEPGERYDPSRDRLYVVGLSVQGTRQVLAVNGDTAPPIRRLQRGTTYRLRLANVHVAEIQNLEWRVPRGDSLDIGAWRRVAKDGATLPPEMQVTTRARQPIGVGETYDFSVTPETPGRYELRIVSQRTVREPMRVRFEVR